MHLDTWRHTVCTIYGKRGRSKWISLVIDLQAVSCGIKRSYLFDLWASSPEEMCRLLQLVHDQGLTKVKLKLAVVGSDLFIYSNSEGSFLEDVEYFGISKFIDVSFSLDKPAIVEENIVKDTLDVFSVFLQFVRNLSCSLGNQSKLGDNSSDLCLWYQVDVTDAVNPSCLYGLFLGYPWIYWFDRAKSDENCLSMQPLHLYQVKGNVCLCDQGKIHVDGAKSCFPEEMHGSNHCSTCACNHDRKAKCESESKVIKSLKDCDHTLFSFSVPENILKLESGFEELVEDWFSKLKTYTHWQQLFCHIWLDQKVVELPTVSL